MPQVIEPEPEVSATRGNGVVNRASNLRVFISYAHEDSEIAVAVSNMLNQTFGRALAEVFLDTRCIPVGAEIGEDIKAALKRADVLVIVSTGPRAGKALGAVRPRGSG